MKTQMRFVAIILLGTCVTVLAAGTKLEQLRNSYENALKKIKLEAINKTNEAPLAYLNALEGLQKKKQMAGDLDGWQAVSKEIKRFQDDGLCPKYGHIMVKVKLSNVRWFYECRICKRTGKSQSIK